MLNVYCCGGAGSNVGKQITDLDINVCFIDTSDSNHKGVDTDKIYQIEGIDGAGKDRKVTYENFKNPDEVLIRFKPSNQLNIVISSLSGGSGSIIAPVLARELIKQGYNVIVIAVDSVHSVKEIDNSIKALMTYKSFSNSIKKAISLFYIQNKSRKDADQRAIHFINMMSLLVNKEHTEEFDTSDLRNFINFDNVTENEPSVSVIEINPNESIVPEKNTNIVSTILLTTDKNSTINEVIPEYLSTCIVTDKNYKNEDIRIDNTLGKLTLIVESLESLKKEHQENKKLSKHKELVVEASTEDGVVL